MNKLFILGLAFIISACGNSSQKGKEQSKKQSETLTGAGATFPLPYYNLAFKTYKDLTGTAITYGGIGSGGGIRSLKDKIVDFAGSDAFLSEKEMSEMPSTIHIPTCMGAIVMAYNLPEVKNMKLTGDIVADIYLGKIKKWNDIRIKAINKEIALPEKDINAIYRSDGSGTTYVFSDYLSKVSNEWNKKVGAGKSLKWPIGLAAKGNPGVAGTISQTAGAIGYIGSEYAFAQNIPVAALQNKAGNFITPNSGSISAAASVELSGDTRVMITNSPAADAYPISCFTWIILYKEQAYNSHTKAHAEAILAMLDWMLSDTAQKLTTKVHYSPIPETAVANARTLLKSVTFEGQTILK